MKNTFLATRAKRWILRGAGATLLVAGSVSSALAFSLSPSLPGIESVQANTVGKTDFPLHKVGDFLDDFSGSCNSYVSVMRDLNDRAQDLSCGFPSKILTGKNWINREACQDMSRRQRRTAVQRAEKRVEACSRRGGGKYNKHCHVFAKTAVKHQEQNLDNWCDFRGNLWSGRYRVHYQRCLNVLHSSPSRLLSEQNERIRKLNQCGAGNVERREACQRYAREASEQFQAARQAGCKPTGKLWNADSNLHYDFCMKSSTAKVKSMIRARRRALYACEDY